MCRYGRRQGYRAGLNWLARGGARAGREQLLENPNEQPVSAYDERTDQWTTVYGDGVGLIVYAVVRERQRLIVLRLI
jgi:hypothetical protein